MFRRVVGTPPRRVWLVAGVCAVAVVVAGSTVWAGVGFSSPPLAGFGSLSAAAASLSPGCAATIPARGLIVDSRGPVVTAAAGFGAGRGFVDRLLHVRLPLHSQVVALWPCTRPVAFYELDGTLWMRSSSKLVSLGSVSDFQPFDSHGRFVATPHVSAPGIVTDVVASSSSPAALVESRRVAEDCPSDNWQEADNGHLWLVSSSGTKLLTSYDTCSEDPAFGWSPSGFQIFWTDGSDTVLNIRDASGPGARRRMVFRGIGYPFPIWSPDGKYVAFTIGGQRTAGGYTSLQATVMTVATRAVRRLTHFRWTGWPLPKRSNESGAVVVGWTRDGKDVVVARAFPNSRRTSYEAVPVSGGRAVTLKP